jgi:F-type H+-transporting ATPase subunit gamma
MPENAKDIKRRIKSVTNTKQITRAMKLVSGAKLRRAQTAVEAARPFAQRLAALVGNLAAAGGRHPLLELRPEAESQVGLLIVSADRGLAGAFNANTLKAAQRYLKERGEAVRSIGVVGRKAIDFFRRRGRSLTRQRADVTSRRFGIELAEAISSELVADFLGGAVHAVDVLFTRFQSPMVQLVTLERLLPIPRPEADPRIQYRFDPSADAILGELLPRYVRTQVFQYLLETSASEHGARMTAMESATRNATEMIGALTLRFNRARQAAITKEIIEIVSGAEALSA